MSKPKGKKKNSYQAERSANIINLVTAILGLAAAILALVEILLK